MQTCNRWLGQQTRVVYFATLLRNELKSDDVRFTTRVATNQVIPGCEKLLQKAESSTFLQENPYIFRFLPAQGKLVLQQVKKRPYMALLADN